jgi:hypothetical protein
MPLSKADSKKIQQFAQEGKQTKRILEDHFPHLTYAEVAAEVRDWGERSALGRMRMITRRINDLAASTKSSERAEMALELQKLVRELYNNHKSSHDKLTTIREALEG